jgi:hypothetical protein
MAGGSVEGGTVEPADVGRLIDRDVNNGRIQKAKAHGLAHRGLAKPATSNGSST